MSDNIVDFSAFKRKKAEEKEKKEEEPPIIAVLNDRQHFKLTPDNMLHGYLDVTGENEVLCRPATNEEIALMHHVLYLEVAVSELLKEHAPHKLYDDYITVPYVDWKMGEINNPAMAEWNAKYKDPDEVILDRRVDVLLYALRLNMFDVNPKNRVGLTVDEKITSGKLIRSERDVVWVHVNKAEALEGANLKATILRREMNESDGVFNAVKIDIPFPIADHRTAFLTDLLNAKSAEQAYDLILVAALRYGGTQQLID